MRCAPWQADDWRGVSEEIMQARANPPQIRGNVPRLRCSWHLATTQRKPDPIGRIFLLAQAVPLRNKRTIYNHAPVQVPETVPYVMVTTGMYAPCAGSPPPIFPHCAPEHRW